MLQDISKPFMNVSLLSTKGLQTLVVSLKDIQCILVVISQQIVASFSLNVGYMIRLEVIFSL